MGLKPRSIAEQIQFCEAHLSDWQTNAVAIGSSAPEIAAIETKTEAARAALTAQETAQETARTKTAALRDAVNAMWDATAQLVTKIRSKAATDGDVVYQLANIPAPATPAPKGPPGLVYAFEAELMGNGALKGTWKCDNPAGATGTIYQIYRRFGGAGPFVYLGGSGEKSYTDDSIPAGTAMVEYQIQAVRSRTVGPWNTFTVLFSTDAGTGVMSAAVQGAAKLAA